MTATANAMCVTDAREPACYKAISEGAVIDCASLALLMGVGLPVAKESDRGGGEGGAGLAAVRDPLAESVLVREVFLGRLTGASGYIQAGTLPGKATFDHPA